MRILAKPQQIRYFSARKNLADYEVAQQVGMTRQQFGQVLIGASSMRPAARRRLLRLLGAEFDDVFEIVTDVPAHA
jgi:chemotaxis response regulator CheB